jgi:hypothetical protein
MRLPERGCRLRPSIHTSDVIIKRTAQISIHCQFFITILDVSGTVSRCGYLLRHVTPNHQLRTSNAYYTMSASDRMSDTEARPVAASEA